MTESPFDWRGKDSPLLQDPYFHSIPYKAFLKARHANPELKWEDFRATTDKPVCQSRGRGAYINVIPKKELA